MTESTLQLIAILKLLVVTGFAALYGFGGLSGKWKRRFLAPAVYAAGIVGVTLWTDTFNGLFLLSALFLSAALMIGYGGNSTGEKIKKRAIAGLTAGIASIPIFWVTGAWTLCALHIFICVAFSVTAGVWNQTQSARAEETLIGAAYILVPMLTI